MNLDQSKEKEIFVRLQICSNNDYTSLLEFLRVQRYIISRTPAIFVDYVYSGTGWDATFRNFETDPSSNALILRTEIEESDGVASHNTIKVPCVEFKFLTTFQQSFNDAVEKVIKPAMRKQEENEAKVGLFSRSEDAPFSGRYHDYPWYCERRTVEWNCKGKEGVLGSGFSVLTTSNENLKEFKSLIDQEAMTVGKDESRKLLTGGRKSYNGKEEFWIKAPCRNLVTPAEMLSELRDLLNILGIKARRHTIEKSADCIDDKRDVKLRIYSPYGYDAFLKNSFQLTESTASLHHQVSFQGSQETFFVDGANGHSQSIRKLKHYDYYFDSAAGHLGQAHSTLRLRGIRSSESASMTYELTFQSSISVSSGEQRRDWMSLSIAASIAESIVNSGKIDLSALGQDGTHWKEIILGYVQENAFPLKCIAHFITTRIQIPWFTSTTQPMNRTVRYLGSQECSKVFNPLLINLDHTQYPYFVSGLNDFTFSQQTASQKNLNQHFSDTHFFEVEVTNIETFTELVKDEIVHFLDKIDVEWQPSVKSKLHMFFEIERARNAKRIGSAGAIPIPSLH